MWVSLKAQQELHNISIDDTLSSRNAYFSGGLRTVNEGRICTEFKISVCS